MCREHPDPAHRPPMPICANLGPTANAEQPRLVVALPDAVLNCTCRRATGAGKGSRWGIAFGIMALQLRYIRMGVI
jgi:hypothetical protein